MSLLVTQFWSFRHFHYWKFQNVTLVTQVWDHMSLSSLPFITLVKQLFLCHSKSLLQWWKWNIILNMSDQSDILITSVMKVSKISKLSDQKWYFSLYFCMHRVLKLTETTFLFFLNPDQIVPPCRPSNPLFGYIFSVHFCQMILTKKLINWTSTFLLLNL